MTISLTESFQVSQELSLLNNSPRDVNAAMSSFTEKLKGFFEKDATEEQLIGTNRIPNPNSIIRSLRKASYADLRTLPVQVPPGLSSSYLAYLESLDEAVTITEGLMDNVLTPFSRWLAIGLSNPDSLNSLNAGRRIQDFKPHQIDKASLALGKHFAKGKTHHERKFGDVFDRNGDVEAVYKKANDTASRFLKTSRKDVMKKVGEVTDLLDTLTKRIEEDEANYKTSSVTRDLIAKLSFTLAQEVEFYAVVGYQLTSLSVALNETEKRIQSVIR